jgi:hypothetical protein
LRNPGKSVGIKSFTHKILSLKKKTATGSRISESKFDTDDGNRQPNACPVYLFDFGHYAFFSLEENKPSIVTTKATSCLTNRETVKFTLDGVLLTTK